MEQQVNGFSKHN